MRAKTVLVCLILAPLTAFLSKTGIIADDRPNVILITVDDLNTNLNCYGNPIIQSRNIDRLAREGARFTRAYCQFPLCNPSRTSFLSGKRPESTGIINNKTNPRTRLADDLFLPEYFGTNGYFTARAGKIMHTDFNDLIDWDSEFNPPSDDVSTVVRDPVLPDWEASDLDDSSLADGQVTRHIIELLRERPDRPFFFAAGFRRPHGPYIAPKRYFADYDIDDIELPADASAGGSPTVKQKKQVMRAYFACISFVDAQIGLILDELDKLDLRKNTIIIFLSDHGLRLGEGNIFGRKRSLDEVVIRVPLILAGPGIPSGLAFDQLVELVDLYPSLAELCGLSAPSALEGVSLMPLFETPNRQWKRAAFTIYTEKRRGFKRGRSVQTDQYKYIRQTSGREFLFNIIEDKSEKNNLVNVRKYSDVLQDMRRLLAEGWRSAIPAVTEEKPAGRTF